MRSGLACEATLRYGLHIMDDSSPETMRTRRWFTVSLLLIAAALGLFLRFTYKTWPNAVELAEKAGRTPKFLEPYQQIFWWTALANVAVIVVLLLTRRWWLRAGGEAAEPALRWQHPNRAVSIGILGLTVFAIALRVPRLDMSLYNDESHNYARYFSGAWKNDATKGEEPRFRETTWIEALTRNTVGNNSQLFTTLARLSLQGWKAAFGGAEGEIIETPVRIPSLIAGIATMLLLGALIWRWRGNEALLWVLLLVAVQAWLVRFQSEARSYSVMLLGVAILFWFLDKALITGRWKHWLGFAFGVLLCAWAFLGSAYFLVAVYLTLLARQVWLWKQGTLPFQQVLRPLLVGMFAALIGAQLFLAFIPPIIDQLANLHSIKGVMGPRWWGDILSHLTWGSRWLESDGTNPVNFSIQRMLERSPVLWLGTLGGAAVLLTGWWCMVKRGGAAMVMAVSSPLALVIAWAAMSRKGNFLLYWYIIYSLPAFIMALAYGLANIGDAIRKMVHQPARATVLSAITGLVLLAPQILCGLHWSHHGKQDERQAVLLARGAVYPHYLGTEGEKALLLCFWSNSPNYDPNSGILSNEEHLNQMIARAKAESRPLFVDYSHSDFATREHPKVIARLKDAAEFTPVATVFGQEEEQFTHYVFRWNGK